MRFNRTAIDDLANERISASVTLHDYLKKLSLCDLLNSHYLPPMAAAIWSSDLDDVNQMPALFFIRFFKIMDFCQSQIVLNGTRYPGDLELYRTANRIV